jgi:hypothetical protein
VCFAAVVLDQRAIRKANWREQAIRLRTRIVSVIEMLRQLSARMARQKAFQWMRNTAAADAQFMHFEGTEDKAHARHQRAESAANVLSMFLA